MRKLKVIAPALFMLFSLTACAKPVPEDGSGMSSYSPFSPFIFVGASLLIFALAALLGVYIIKKTPKDKHHFYFRIFTLIGIIFFTIGIFPINIAGLINDFSSNILNAVVGLMVSYQFSLFTVKIYSTTKGRLIALLGGSSLGLATRYLLEFGEVSNTTNFTASNIIIFFVITLVIFLLVNKPKNQSQNT